MRSRNLSTLTNPRVACPYQAKATDKTTDVRVIVDGKLGGDVIAVSDVKIAD